MSILSGDRVRCIACLTGFYEDPGLPAWAERESSTIGRLARAAQFSRGDDLCAESG